MSRLIPSRRPGAVASLVPDKSAAPASSKFSSTLNTLAQVAERNSELSELRSTAPISKFRDKEFRSLLRSMYRNAELKFQAAASVLNAVFKEGKATFLLPRNGLSALISGDPNRTSPRGELNGSEFFKIGLFLEETLFQQLRANSSAGTKIRPAAKVIELKDEALVAAFDQIYGADFRGRSKKICLQAHDSYTNSENGLPHRLPPSTSNEGEMEWDGVEFENSPSLSSTTGGEGNPALTPALQVTPESDESCDTTSPVQNSRESDAKSNLDQIDRLEVLGWLYDNGKISLTEFERNFVTDNAAKLNKYNNGLLDKQLKKLGEIEKKYSAPLAARMTALAKAEMIKLFRCRPKESDDWHARQLFELHGERYFRAVEHLDIQSIRAEALGPDDAPSATGTSQIRIPLKPQGTSDEAKERLRAMLAKTGRNGPGAA